MEPPRVDESSHCKAGTVKMRFPKHGKVYGTSIEFQFSNNPAIGILTVGLIILFLIPGC